MGKPTFEEQARSLRAERKRLGASSNGSRRSFGSASTNPTEPSDDGSFDYAEGVLTPAGSLSGGEDGPPRQETAMLDLMSRSLEDLLLSSAQEQKERVYERIAWLIAVFVTAVASGASAAVSAVFATLSMIF